MSVLEYQSGITTPKKDSRPLYIIHLSQFDSWLDSLSETARNWVRETAMPAKVASCISLPGSDGHIQAAALIIDENIIWQSAMAANTLPAGSWIADMAFAEQACPADIQLGWGLAQYHFAPHKPEKSADRKALLAIAKKEQDKAVDAQVRAFILCVK